MRYRRWPQPSEAAAERFRRAHEELDHERVGHYERAGFGYDDGYHGAYAERWGYAAPRGRRYPPRPEGSGWPHPVYELPPTDEERHLRALADRDLAYAVDRALYQVIGRHADNIEVYANDAVVTLAGHVSHPEAAERALDAAFRIPGVQRVRNALRTRRW